MNTTSNNQLLTPAEAADYLSVKTQTLAVWRSAHRHGLPYVKMGGAIRYRRADLDAWIASRTVTPDAR